jgi:hypothetical protein
VNRNTSSPSQIVVDPLVVIVGVVGSWYTTTVVMVEVAEGQPETEDTTV